MTSHKIYLLFFCIAMLSVSYAQQPPCAFEQVQHELMKKDPVYQAEVEQYIQEVLPRLSRQTSNARSVVTIPVVVHVIHSGQSIGTGANLSFERIQSQIDILNQDYRRLNDDVDQTPADYTNIAADTEIQFCLAALDANGNVSNGITRHVYSNIPDIDYIENTIKPETNWDPSLYMNIWTIDMPSNTVIGYSYLPTATIVGFNKDGVVIDYPNFGYVDAGNRGRTTIHEVGHYLGLRHTWGETDADGDPIGCSSDDGISDTPNCSGPHYGCPNFGLSSCGNIDMIMNYMEYVNDDCMNLFTNGQKNVMQATLNGPRSALINHSNLACNAVDLSCRDIRDAAIIMGFEANEATGGWIVENANTDTRTWVFSPGGNGEWGPNNGQGLAVYLWNTNGNTPADDYLFTPCFEIRAGNTYQISFSYACAADANDVYLEDFEVGVSLTQSSSDFVVVNEDWIFEGVDNAYPDYNDQVLYFEATTSTQGSIGFHVKSEADRYALQIDDIKILDLGTSSSNEILEAHNHIEIHPNPNVGVFNLVLELEKPQRVVDIEIYDTLGRLIQQQTLQNITNNTTNFDLSAYESGIYFVRVQSADLMLSKKILLKK